MKTKLIKDSKELEKTYKPSITIQVDRNNLSLLQQKQISAFIACASRGLVRDPYSLNPKQFPYVFKNKNLFKHVYYCLRLSDLMKYSFYSSRDNKHFIEQLRELARVQVTFNILKKDKYESIGFLAPIFQVFGIDNQDVNFQDVLSEKNDGYVYFTFSNIIDEKIKEKSIGCFLPLRTFKSKYG